MPKDLKIAAKWPSDPNHSIWCGSGSSSIFYMVTLFQGLRVRMVHAHDYLPPTTERGRSDGGRTAQTWQRCLQLCRLPPSACTLPRRCNSKAHSCHSSASTPYLTIIFQLARIYRKRVHSYLQEKVGNASIQSFRRDHVIRWQSLRQNVNI